MDSEEESENIQDDHVNDMGSSTASLNNRMSLEEEEKEYKPTPSRKRKNHTKYITVGNLDSTQKTPGESKSASFSEYKAIVSKDENEKDSFMMGEISRDNNLGYNP